MQNLAQVNIGDKFLGQGAFLTDIGDVGKLVSLVVQSALVIAGLVFLFLLILGGISMIAGAGNNNPEQAAKGKQAVTSAAIGFVVVFAAYWIVQLIEILTGISILQ